MSKKIFMGGSRSNALFGQLPESVRIKIDDMMKKEYSILIGDANGSDKLIQQYLRKHDYKKVTIYYAGAMIRNKEDADWGTVHVPDASLTGRKLQTLKDEKMVNDAEGGYMIWSDTYLNRYQVKSVSSGTLLNIINLLDIDKPVIVYYAPNKKTYILNSFVDFDMQLLPVIDQKTQKKYKELRSKMGQSRLL